MEALKDWKPINVSKSWNVHFASNSMPGIHMGISNKPGYACVCVCPLSSFEFCKATPSTPLTLRIINSATMWDVTFYEDSLKTIPQSQATKGRISKTIRWTISISGRMIKPTNAGEIRIYADRRAQVWRECQLPHLWPSLSHKKSVPSADRWSIDPTLLDQKKSGCPIPNSEYQRMPCKECFAG